MARLGSRVLITPQQQQPLSRHKSGHRALINKLIGELWKENSPQTAIYLNSIKL